MQEVEEENYKQIIDDIVEEYEDNLEEAKISILQKIQEELGYVGEEYLEYTSSRTEISLSELYGIATFYTQFKIRPAGRHDIQVCEGTTCYVKGNQRNREKLQELLDVDVGETTEDLKFTLKSVRCLGCCSLAPVIRIDEDTYGRVRPSDVEDILNNYE